MGLPLPGRYNPAFDLFCHYRYKASMKRSSTCGIHLCLGLLLMLGPVSARVFCEETRSSGGEQVFESNGIVPLHLSMTEEQFAALAPQGTPTFGPPGFGKTREQPPGTHRNQFGVDFPWSQGEFTFDGQTLKNVGIRFKGNYTYMAAIKSLKKSFKVDFNRHNKGQSLNGLKMINMHCNVSDPTQAREAMSYAFFREAGVPASRTAFAELTISVTGKYEQEFVGVYTVVEQVDEEFLTRHFKDGTGMLLKPEQLQGGPIFLGDEWKDYAQKFRPEVEPSPAQMQRLIDFTKLISKSSDEEFAKGIGDFLDVDAFLKFIACNMLLSNLDSYLGFGHNYYLYLVPDSNRFVFIPWDLDLSLATWPAVGTPEQLVELSIHHPCAGKNRLVDRLFAVPEFKDKYLGIVKELSSTLFTTEKLHASWDGILSTLHEPLEREKQAIAARNEEQGTSFGPGFGNGQFGQSMPHDRFIELRTASIAAQLAGEEQGFEPKPFGFGFGPPPQDNDKQKSSDKGD